MTEEQLNTELAAMDWRGIPGWWSWGTWNPERIPHWRLVTSPVAGDGIILVCAPERDPIYAVKAGGNGQLDDSCPAWVSCEAKEVSSGVPTPALYDGDSLTGSKASTGLLSAGTASRNPSSL